MQWADVRLVVFDLGGTLIRNGRSATSAIGDLFGVGLDEMRRELDVHGKRTRIPAKDLVEDLTRRYGRPDLAGPLHTLLQRLRTEAEEPRLFEDAAPAIEELCRRGYAIALLSNIIGTIAPRHTRLFDLADAVFSSCDSGLVKPEIAAFRQVEAAFGADPYAAVHVGDSYESDYEGALRAGWRSVFLDRDPDASGNPPVPQSERTYSVNDLRALADLLPQRASSSGVGTGGRR